MHRPGISSVQAAHLQLLPSCMLVSMADEWQASRFGQLLTGVRQPARQALHSCGPLAHMQLERMPILEPLALLHSLLAAQPGCQPLWVRRQRCVSCAQRPGVHRPL